MATVAAEVRRARAPVEQPQQSGLALTYHRLMLVMLLFVGVTLVIVGRLAILQIFTDRSPNTAATDPRPAVDQPGGLRLPADDFMTTSGEPVQGLYTPDDLIRRDTHALRAQLRAMADLVLRALDQ